MDGCPRFRFRFRPPTHPSYGGAPLESVVLDRQAYIDDRTNATTASGTMAGGHVIKVTFWIAHPPRVSHFTVHFPNLPDLTALAQLPHILCTDDDLIILRVAICPNGFVGLPKYNDYIIYRAGSDKLQVLPPHPTRVFSHQQVGLLRCRGAAADDDRFIVASLRHANTRGSDIGDYLLEMFDSRTWTWSTKTKYADRLICPFTLPSKVITIGGEHGSIGWIDLANGILIADVLGHDDDHILRYILLPKLMVPNKLLRGPMSADRDIIASNGDIKYIELCVHPVQGSLIDDTYISHDWQAAAWTWNVNVSDKEWVVDGRFSASEIMVDERCSRLLPTLPRDEEAAKKITETKPTLSRLHVGHPALSLHEDDAVYIMAKVDYLDHQAWMIAVDMRNKTLKQVVDFDAQRTMGFSTTYLQSGVSKYLRFEVEEEGDSLTEDAPWIEVSGKKKKCQEQRCGCVSCEIYIL